MVKINFFTDKNHIEENALFRLNTYVEDSNIDTISVFPDIHFCSEKSIPVGVAFESKDVFYPLITGKDIGCG
jgi:hypothetical protein